MKKYKYNINNLDCANCARELERCLNKNKNFKNVVVNFNTSKLIYESEKDFTIKDCERFLKKSGLTNAGFKAFFQRLCELKGCRRNNREKTDKSENEIQNSLEENEQTPEELKNLNNNLRNLQILLKIKD